MSTAAGRAALVAALGEVDGLHPHPSKPPTLAPGTCWPRWDGYGNAREGGHPAYWLSRWSVFVVLDGSAVTNESILTAWVDANIDALTDALRPAGYVDSVEPARLDVEQGAPVPGIRITITRE